MRKRLRPSHEVYHRQLPGGGYVAIEVSPSRTFLGQRSYHGEVVVERRNERERRAGHEAPIVAQADAPDLDQVFHDLFPVAHSNTAIAIGCLEHQRQLSLL